MLKIFYFMVLILKLTSCQRRITDGSRVGEDVDTRFMVYLVGAMQPFHVTGWLCGGCIIHPSLVLTSGTCLAERAVKNKYVIAGYRKYVSTENLEQDQCTKHMKKRIVSYCTHSKWNTTEMAGHKETKGWNEGPAYRWTKYDLGVARTDTPFDFFDNDYLKYCSYRPKSIKINFNRRYVQPRVDVVVYGWGHSTYYRPHEDVNDYNEKYLMYTSSVLLNQTECQKPFKHDQYLWARFHYNAICAAGKGNLDASGRQVALAKPVNSKCSSGNKRRFGDKSEMDCNNSTASVQDSHSNETISTKDSVNASIGTTRRHGICQNDHGSPLIRWIGAIPHVIGIASSFIVNQRMECIDFSVYIRLTCLSTRNFLKCVLDKQQTNLKGRRSGSYCDKLVAKGGYRIQEEFFDWSDEDF